MKASTGWESLRPGSYPDADYERWIPPRTTSGEYNDHIAAILREKLLKD